MLTHCSSKVLRALSVLRLVPGLLLDWAAVVALVCGPPEHGVGIPFPRGLLSCVGVTSGSR